MAIVKVQGRGQITIPAKFREKLGIESGYALLLRQIGERQFIVNVIPHRTPADFPTVDIDVDMDQIREEIGRTIANEVYPGEQPEDVLAADREAAAAMAEDHR